MRALGGSWAALAAEFGGSHLVMKCFDFAVRSAMRFSILAVRFCRLPTFSVSRGDRTRRLPWRITEPNSETNYANHAHHEAQIVITSLQGVADKEAIVQELVGARRTLYASPRGTAVRLFSGSLYLPSLSPCICLLWVPSLGLCICLLLQAPCTRCTAWSPPPSQHAESRPRFVCKTLLNPRLLKS